MKTKRIAVIAGATGLTGSYLLKELIENEYYSKIILLVRKPMNKSLEKISEIITDFSKNDLLNISITANDLFCCIGTTIKKAGSKEQMKTIDHHIPVNLAEMALKNTFNKFIVISSIGANHHSRNFYLRTKGEMEQDLKSILPNKFFIIRPSLILGKRNEIRTGEKIGKIIMTIFGFLLLGKLKKYKAIHVSTIAKAMVNIALHDFNDIIYESNMLEQIAKTS